METTVKVILKAEYARLIQPFIADEETRFYLNGFFVHKDRNEGVRIVATDGHRLAVFHDETGSCDKPEGVIVKLDKYALAFFKRDQKWEPAERYLTLHLKDSMGTITMGHPSEGAVVATVKVEIIDGTFPEYERCMPSVSRKKRHVSHTYNLKQLAEFGKVVEGQAPLIRVIGGEREHDPALVLTQRQDFFGLLMPWRESIGSYYPDWFTKPPPTRLLPPPSAKPFSTDEGDPVAA
jgi:hypothetical protein